MHIASLSAESMLDEAIEHMPCAVSVFDAGLRLVAHNRLYRTLLEFPDHLFEPGADGSVDFERFVRFNAERGDYGPCDVETVTRRLVELARNPQPHRLERMRPNGTVVEIRGTPMPGGGFVSTYTDITEQRRAEKALRRSEERQQRALDAAGLALWDCDVASGEVWLSEAWNAMLGGERRPTVTTFEQLAMRVPDEDQPQVLHHMARVMKGEADLYEVEHRVRREDGSEFWIQSKGRVTERDAQGMALRFIGTNRDVTKRRQFTAELHHTSQLLGAVLEAAHGVHIVCVDHKGCITVFNRGAELMLGWSAAEVMGKHASTLFHDPQQLEARRRELSLVLGREAQPHEIFSHPSVIGVPVEWTAIRKDGSRFTLSMSITELHASTGEVIGYLGTGHDVTRQREHERSLREAKQAAEQAAHAKAAFLATMSHEIRTPMNGVIGMTSMLLDTALTPEQREFTEVIRQCGEGLLVVINDILDYSKIESGRMELEWLPLDLQDCIEGSIELLAPKAQERHLELLYMIEPEVPPWIEGDLPRLRQILVNLLSNAIKFTERGEVVIQVGLARDEDEGLTAFEMERPLFLEFRVRDTGIGIPPEKIRQLFQPFTQVDSSTSRKFGGTGLGLAISRRLAQAMGGDMSVHSAGEGRGTTFRFTVRTQAAQAVPQPGRIGLSGLRGKRALLVDDNPTNLRVLGLQAQRWGMRHETSASGAHALELLRGREGFDVLVSDMDMPGMDGITLAQQVRALKPQLPLILLSSVDMRRSQHADLFSAVLMKPVRQVQLFEALVRALPEGAAATPAPQRAPSRFDPELGKRHPLRILVADDNEVNCRVALHLLRAFGYTADTAGNGLEVLDALRRQPYDLILMDIQMPEMDGLQATRSIVRNWPAAMRPRIVAMSANALREETDAALSAGMDDYITKPVGVAALRAVLAACPLNGQAPAGAPDSVAHAEAMVSQPG